MNNFQVAIETHLNDLEDQITAIKSSLGEIQNELAGDPAAGYLKLNGATFPEQLTLDLESLKNLVKNLRVKLNLVIVGRFNSGKSMLINSLIGKEIAAVDETEMTYSLNYITYGATEAGIVHFHDGSSQEMEIEKLNELIKSNRDSRNFTESIADIQFYYPYHELEKINIWDTPGLGSLSQENRERTLSIIKESDIVLWVIDATAIGDLSDRKDMENTLSLNKPVIALVNKMDLVTANDATTQISEYFNRNFPNFFKRIFFVSAKQKWQELSAGEVPISDSSGIGEVKAFLEEKIFRQKEEIVTLSTINSLIQSLQALDDSLGAFKDLVEDRCRKYEDFCRELDEQTKDILDKLTISIKSYVSGYVFQEEFEDLVKKLERLNLNGQSRQELEKLTAASFTDRAATKYITDVEQNINLFLRNSWEIAVGTSTESVRQQYECFAIHQAAAAEDPAMYLNKLNVDYQNTFDQVSRGALIGGGVGLGAAAVVSALSSTITAAAIIPGTIVGLAVGAVLGFVKSSQDEKLDLRQFLLDKLNEYKQIFYQDIVEQNLLPQAKQIHEAIRREILEKAAARFLLFQPEERNWELTAAIAGCSGLVEMMIDQLNEAGKKYHSEENGLFEDTVNYKDFIILRDNPGPGVEQLQRLFSTARRFVYIIDPYFNVGSLEWLGMINSNVSVKVLLSHLDEDLEAHQSFKEALKRIRNERKATVLVRLIKYRYKGGSPIHDRYVFTESLTLSIGNSLDAVGKQDIVCSFLTDHQKFQKEIFAKYWNASAVQFKDRQESVSVYDL